MLKLILTIVLLLFATSDSKGQYFSYSEDAGRAVISTQGQNITSDGEFALANLITDPSIIDSLELTGLQKRRLRVTFVELGKTNREATDKAMELMKASSNISEVTALQDDLSKQMRASNRMLTSSVKDILLEHQFAEVSGIAADRFFSEVSVGEIFSENSGVLKLLEMTDAENADVAEKLAQVQKNLKEDIKTLKREAAFEMIRSFPKDKQDLFQRQFGLEVNQ